VASHTLLPAAGATAEQIIAAASNANLETILVTRYLGKSTEEVYHPGTIYYDVAPAYGRPHVGGFGGYYGYAYEVAYDQPVWTSNVTHTIVSDLYEPNSAKPIWQAVSETVKASSDNKLRNDAINGLIGDLTETCRRCHLIDRATIARVRDDQDLLRRAEFDHRAHVLQVRCLECHAEIPVLEHLEGAAETDPEIDRAATRNLPRIENCQRCHNPRQTSNRCVTCHQFHPDKSRRSTLRLNLNAEGGRDDASQAVLEGG
jgi:hypothetical protein